MLLNPLFILFFMPLRIILRKIERPFPGSPEDDFTFFCRSFGFFEQIDKEKTASRVFREIVVATEQGNGISSQDLSKKLSMSRGAINNHLHNLLYSGLVMKEGRLYKCRAGSLQRLMDELQADIERIFFELRKTAVSIDKEVWKESKE